MVLAHLPDFLNQFDLELLAKSLVTYDVICDVIQSKISPVSCVS